MKSVTSLNLCSFLAAGRTARPNEKAIKVDTKLVDAFFAYVATAEADIAAAEAAYVGVLADKDKEIAALNRQLAEAKAKIPAEPAE